MRLDEIGKKMKVRDLQQWLAKFDDNLPVVFCSGDSEQLNIFQLSDIAISDAHIQRNVDGILECKFGRNPISKKHVFIKFESA